MSSRYYFGELTSLTPQMQAKLPGAMLETGYSISGPNESGYFKIEGLDLPTPAFIPPDVAFYHPKTKKLIYQPYIPPLPKEEAKFPFFGWIIIAAIVLFIISN